jgi:FMN phosphatase YigB (HAD superfamily)
LFEGVTELIRELSKKYILCLVSLAKRESPEIRRKKIEESGIAEFFNLILVGGEDKDSMYENILSNLNLSPQEVIMVDDRVVRGISWGNRNGAQTVWVKKGKFANELPHEETGNPHFIINEIQDLLNVV